MCIRDRIADVSEVGGLVEKCVFACIAAFDPEAELSIDGTDRRQIALESIAIHVAKAVLETNDWTRLTPQVFERVETLFIGGMNRGVLWHGGCGRRQSGEHGPRCKPRSNGHGDADRSHDFSPLNGSPTGSHRRLLRPRWPTHHAIGCWSLKNPPV